MKKIIINHSIEASVVSTGFHLENFPWGGSSLGSSCYVCTNVWCRALMCGVVISMWCHDIVSMPWVSLCLWFNFSIWWLLWGETGFFGGEGSPLPPPPPVDETLVNPPAYVAMDEEQNKTNTGTIKTRDITAAMAEQELRQTQLERWGKREWWRWDDEKEA